MIELQAKIDMPWEGIKKGDKWQVPNLLGLARHQITLGQAEVASSAPSPPVVATTSSPSQEVAPQGAEVEEAPKKRRGRPRKN
tara:strand:- start:2891 stop:3139 length:249 start_codon:yes stop_codon:yes gene_type:complete